MKKRFLSILLALCMVIGLMPATAFADVGMESVHDFVQGNFYKVGFAGHTWNVAGDGTKGVYSIHNHLTLADASGTFGDIFFRNGSKESFENSTYYDGWYFANNPEGMEPWLSPSEYAGSTLQLKMEEIAETLPEKEQALITPRSFTGSYSYETPSSDGIGGDGVVNQKLWALSASEAKGFWGVEYPSNFWLRSPDPTNGSYVKICYWQSQDQAEWGVTRYNVYIRPALSLDISSALFISYASEKGKSSATVGGSLVSASAVTTISPVKYTMKDSSQTITVYATPEQSTQTAETLALSYADATAGTNQYVSCVLTDENNDVKYYGKLADSSAADSGDISVPLAGIADGTYTLKIFSEEANGDLYTDFCSEPVTMTVTVANGSGTVSDFRGSIKHDHIWSEEWSMTPTHHWHECENPPCPTIDNSQKDSYGEHVYDQEVVSNIYKVSDATCTQGTTYYKSCVCGRFSTTETFTSGDVNPENHTGTCEWNVTAITHEKKWNCCGAVVVAEEEHEWTENGDCSECGYPCEHAGVVDDGDCTTAVVCGECGSTLVEANPSHTWGAWKANEDDTHTRRCLVEGCTAGVETESCTDENKDHICDYCAKVLSECADDDKDHKCDYCGLILSECTDENEDHVCDYCGKTVSDHTGGCATCISKAVCEYCGEEYGEFDVNTHMRINHVPAVAATKTSVGNIEYWYCGDCGKYFSDENITTEIAKKDTVIPKIAPVIISGNGAAVTNGEKKDLTFTSDAAFEDFIRMEVDGAAVDPNNYTVKSGSTVVTLKGDYVATLSVGEHTIGIVSDGGTAEAKFTVNKKADNISAATDNTKNINSPQTGQESNMMLWIVLLIVCGGAIAATVIVAKKKKCKR